MFFFFKQKTAYELRISDWSSDVCSSDLGSCHHRQRAALAAHHRLQRFGDGVLCDAVDAAVAADEDHVERDQRVLHPEARDPGLGKGKEHAAVLRQFGAKHQRSEEHTSELQSLMRISYAVFCLKQKHDEKNRRHTTTYDM